MLCALLGQPNIAMTIRSFHSVSLSGTTLLEVLLYSALVSVIIGAFFLTSNFFLLARDRDQERAEVYENQRFLTQKIETLLSGATADIVLPASGTGTVLGVGQGNGTYKSLHLTGTNLSLGIGTDVNNDKIIDSYSSDVAITNTHVTISNFSIQRLLLNSQSAFQIQATFQGKYNLILYTKTEYLL